MHSCKQKQVLVMTEFDLLDREEFNKCHRMVSLDVISYLTNTELHNNMPLNFKRGSAILIYLYTTDNS